MTGKTHRQGGMLVSIIGFALLKEQGLLLPDINVGIQWLMMYPFCYWASTASDLDHHWDSCPSKDYPSWLINKALHLTAPAEKALDKTLTEGQKDRNVIYNVCRLFNAHHRSWQTHSDLTLIVMLYLLDCVLHGRITALGAVDTSILTLILMGICIGIIAHFLLDMITPDGIVLVGGILLNRVFKVCKMRIRVPERIRLVPRTQFFATGGKWEHIIQFLLKIGTVVSILYMLYLIMQQYNVI
jgi:membrane-bound metal-dependent hydrolase YbcI (DUF457 family)